MSTEPNDLNCLTGGKKYYLISKRERWGLTWQGRLFLLSVLLALLLLFINNIYNVLAPVDRVKADILVVEGSVTDHVLNHALAEFRSGHYKLLLTTGTPLDYGSYLSEYKNTAFVTGYSLMRLGFDSSRIVMLASDAVMHDRTYNSAIKLKQYLKTEISNCKSINLICQGVHGGRSRLLFRAALGDSIAVGVISVPGVYYSANSWWRSSKGFREVMNEVFGYFYVRFFFRPYEIEPEKK